MNARRPLARRQADRLDTIRQLGLFTDLSLSAKLTSIGDPRDDSTISKYRKGEREAPFSLLDVILDHCNSPEDKAKVLDLWAKDHDLQVTPRVERDVRRALPAEILDVIRKATRLLERAEAGASIGELQDLRMDLLREATEAGDAAVAEAK